MNILKRAGFASCIAALTVTAGGVANADTIENEVNCTHSVNGAPIKPLDQMVTWSVGDTEFYAAPGEATRVLRDFASWFDRVIEPINGPHPADDWSWAPPEYLGDSRAKDSCGNHGSGAAIDLNATEHPMHERGTFSFVQSTLIRAKVASYGGSLAWGGNWVDPVDEMHFEYVG